MLAVARRYTHSIAFRTSADSYRRLQALRSTFPEMGWGEMFRWLLEQEPVKDTIMRRVNGASDDYVAPRGIDGALPVGDR